MPGRQYLDFVLSIERLGNGYRAKVDSYLLNNPHTAVSLPPDESLKEFLECVDQARGEVSRNVRPVGPVTETEEVKGFGAKLYRAIFADQVETCFLRSLDQAEHDDKGLRIRLRLDAPELATWPWEYLYRPDTREFLGRLPKTPIVRSLDVPRPNKPLLIQPPLRVLVMISAPQDVEYLDAQSEWSRIIQATSGLEPARLVVKRLECATLQALQDELQHEKYHVFHYIGHGAYGLPPQPPEGYLILENEQKKRNPVSASRLKEVLSNASTIRLVVLNTCQGGRTSADDPFAGTAQSLLQAGIPAVIAMQFEISDGAAISFGREFYKKLASGCPVDEAVAGARQGIYLDGNEMEWGTPVLYMRTPDGVLFSLAPEIGSSNLSDEPNTHLVLDSAGRKEYAKAIESFGRRRWEDAVKRLERIAAQYPEFGDPDQIEAAAKEGWQREQRIQGLRLEAERLLQDKRWEEALSKTNLLLALDPNYDPQGDAENARRHLEDQHRIALLYQDACSLLHLRRYSDALEKMSQIRNLDSHFSDPQSIESKVQMRREFDQATEAIYQEAVRALQEKQWLLALDKLEQIRKRDIYFRDRDRVDAAAREGLETERRAKDLYDEAYYCLQNQQWQAALAKLEHIQQENPLFSDDQGIEGAAQEGSRREREISVLYDEARRSVKSRQWEDAQGKVNRIRAKDRTFADPEQIDNAVQEAMQRKKRTDSLYQQAQAYLQGERWHLALDCVSRAIALDSAFVDSKDIAKAARTGLAREEQAAKLQQEIGKMLKDRQFQQAERTLELARRLDSRLPWIEQDAERIQNGLQEEERIFRLYAEARTALQERQWKQAEDSVAKIRGIFPAFADPEKIAKQAQDAIERQAKVDALERKAQEHVKGGQWGDALKKVDEIRMEDPEWVDKQRIEETARKGEEADQLYSEAKARYKQRRWRDVLSIVAQIRDRQRDYGDLKVIENRAKRGLEWDEGIANLRQKVREFLHTAASPLRFVLKHWQISCSAAGILAIAITVFASRPQPPNLGSPTPSMVTTWTPRATQLASGPVYPSPSLNLVTMPTDTEAPASTTTPTSMPTATQTTTATTVATSTTVATLTIAPTATQTSGPTLTPMEAPRICAAINQVWIYDRAGCGRDESTGCTDSDNNGCPDDNNDCQRKFARQGEQVSMLPNSLSVPEYPKDWVRVRIDRDGTAIIGWIRISQLKCP